MEKEINKNDDELEKELYKTEGETESENSDDVMGEITEEPDINSLDKEEIISAFLSGDDQKLFELLTPHGFTEEEITSAKEQFLTAARKSLFRRDLQEILSKYKLNVVDIRDIPNYQKYAVLRSNGFSAIEAFESANPKMTLKSVDGDRTHMTPVTSRQGSSGDIPIPERDLKLWQSAFPKASMEELTKRYNKARRA